MLTPQITTPTPITDLSGYLKLDQTTPQTTFGRFTFPALTVDTNTFYVDEVNHRVGIGTTNPVTGNIFYVSGNVGVESSTSSGQGRLNIYGKNSGTRNLSGYLIADTWTGGLQVQANGGALRLITSGTNYINFESGAGGTQLGRWLGNGNFGILRTNPNSALDVNGAITVGTMSTASLRATMSASGTGQLHLNSINAQGVVVFGKTLPWTNGEDLGSPSLRFEAFLTNLNVNGTTQLGTGVQLTTVFDGVNRYGLKIAYTTEYMNIYPNKKDLSPIAQGDFIAYDSATDNYYPTKEQWKEDTANSALKISNNYNKVELTNCAKATQSGEVAIGNCYYGDGEAGYSINTMYCDQQSSGVGVFKIFGDTNFKLENDFTYAFDFDVVYRSNGVLNRYKFKATVERKDGLVYSLGDILTIPDNTSYTWYLEGSGGTDILPNNPSLDTGVVLQLDTSTVNKEILLKINLSETNFSAIANVQYTKLYRPTAYESTYYATNFVADPDANGTYNDISTPYNGKPSFQNSFGYTLRYDSTNEWWEIVTSMSSVVAYYYSIQGSYISEGAVSSTPPSPSYTGTGFTDTNADGGYYDTYTTNDAQPVYQNANGYKLIYHSGYDWIIEDTMSSYKYQSITITGTYNDYSTSLPDGSIS